MKTSSSFVFVSRLLPFHIQVYWSKTFDCIFEIAFLMNLNKSLYYKKIHFKRRGNRLLFDSFTCKLNRREEVVCVFPILIAQLNMPFSMFGITKLFQDRYGLKSSQKKYDKDTKSKAKFEQSNRYSRRGIVISSCVDQMESMFIEPDTHDIIIFRVDVHGKF